MIMQEPHTKIQFEVQYSDSNDRVWVHSSLGETVGRFDVRFGMDIHRSVTEQMNGSPQCLHCTHTSPSKDDRDFFIRYAETHWKVQIDESRLRIPEV